MRFEYVDKLFRLLKEKIEAKDQWCGALDLLSEILPVELLNAVAQIDIKKDFKDARSWVNDNLKNKPDTNGVYIGIDTANIQAPVSKCLEMGLSSRAILSEPDEWLYDDSMYHVSDIELKEMQALHRIYAESEWDSVFDDSDLLLPFVYSGALLLDVFKVVKVKQKTIVYWGHVSGELRHLATLR